mmetsp:Transcript_614/g.2161  ORF Transcript_614/g.2161 Transcript_614/m.2161 type:complete len:215 (+) Transcript_614:341-985(+)
MGRAAAVGRVGGIEQDEGGRRLDGGPIRREAEALVLHQKRAPFSAAGGRIEARPELEGPRPELGVDRRRLPGDALRRQGAALVVADLAVLGPLVGGQRAAPRFPSQTRRRLLRPRIPRRRQHRRRPVLHRRHVRHLRLAGRHPGPDPPHPLALHLRLAMDPTEDRLQRLVQLLQRKRHVLHAPLGRQVLRHQRRRQRKRTLAHRHLLGRLVGRW